MWRPGTILLWAGVLGLACGSESSDLTSFEGSECKSRATANVVFRASAADYEGMQCIVWEPGDHGMVIDLFNFPGECENAWQADARVAPGEVELRLIDPDPDGGADCGSCLYDWHFELDGMDQSGDVTLGISVSYEAGDEPDIQIVLPLDERPSGSRCDYADAWSISEYAWTHERCGAELMPCQVLNPDGYCECGTCSDPPVPCEAGLECTPLNANVQLCHAPCQADDDCAPGRSCQMGLCRPAEPW